MTIRYVIEFLVSGTRGGPMRAKILKLLGKKPLNTNQVSTILKIDYKTAQHHLRVLEENSLIWAVGKGRYGSVYRITEDMERNTDLLGQNWDESGKK